ncbi:MAG TPA: hypothetical protein QGF58_30765, partial [Myxococcota bacterium]|nr:hypothetical protein [Myxococcota bacterium]HJN78335.1 hypothetical protein [Myxococcota bacterium]
PALPRAIRKWFLPAAVFRPRPQPSAMFRTTLSDARMAWSLRWPRPDGQRVAATRSLTDRASL